ncbi:RHS repeat-associated core domain-containing protein, partial [Serratia sp. SRS-8-S-2018]|uniref:RHS repeat-associated core domain-containing protein n=1 Tax=Serratia sp. SRS-8-S-2018 TaxID=2591107 RepID=UPI0011405D72
MNTQPSFFTQAVNFISTVAGGVDPRTGLYNVTLSLAQLKGNRGMGPVFPVILKYTPLATLNKGSTGLGEGFSLGLSAYDRTSGALTLSTGEHYQVVEGIEVEGIEEDTLFLQQKKLDNVRFEKDTANNRYRVLHRNGDIELLQGPDSGFDIKMPVRLMTAAGHSLTLSWDTQNRLVSVRDNNGTPLLTVSYPDNSTAGTHLHLYPGTDEGYDVVLEFSNDRLTRVRSHALQDTLLEWSLEYTAMSPDVWGEWLTGVTGPAGAREEAIYRLDGQGNAFPEEAGPDYPVLPYVTLYRHNPGGGQPTMEVQYSYTPHNFLGYESGNPDWQHNQDNLYNCLTDYTYGSTETHVSDDGHRSITRTYNNFHLQIREETCQGDTCKTQDTVYYARVGVGFDAQPPQYQLPEKLVVTWKDVTGQRSEITQTTFDAAGNLLTQMTPEGILTTYDYYPAAGSGVDCPSEPNGFTRFMKSVTVTPVKTKTAWPGVPVARTQYLYAACTPVPGTVKGLVMKSEERHYSDGMLLKRVDFQYEPTDMAYAGQLVGRLSRHYPAGETGEGYTTQETFTLKEGDTGTLIKGHTVLTADSLFLKNEDTLSQYTGHILKSEDPQGNVVQYEYDRLGRQTKKMQQPGTPYENVWLYDYSLDPHAELPLSVITTDPLKNQQREGMDGAGRCIKRETRNVGSAVWSVTGSRKYDRLGRNVEDTITDWLLPNTHQNTDSNRMVQTRTPRYDGWGQLCSTQFSDGTTTRTSYDPVTRQSTASISGAGVDSGRQVTTFDAGGHPVEVSLYSVGETTAYSSRRKEYDGLGRLRQETDALGNRTRYDYDAWGRLVVTTLPDSTTVTRHYAANSADALLAEIAVNGRRLGKQTFDGLGRLLTRTSGGRTWQYNYALPADTRPASEQTPDGVVRQYTYLRELGEALTSVRAGNITQTFSYNPLTRALKQSRENDIHLQYDYLPSGHLKSTRATYGQKQVRSQSQTYSVLGQHHTVTDWSGETVAREYDTHGWLTTFRDGTVLMQLRYDGARRLTGWKVSSVVGDYWQDTALTLDDFGREVQRVLTDNQQLTLIVNRSWDLNDRVIGLQTRRGDEMLRDETFQYDNRGRLIGYKCAGSEPPEDEFGGLRQQLFRYDATGNVTWRETRYTDNSVNQSVFLYKNKDDSCQLTTVTHSHPGFPKELVFSRDVAGRMTVDEAGRRREYDALGRLCSLTWNGTTQQYQYDAGNRLVQEANTALYYLDDRLNVRADDRSCTRLVRGAEQAVAQVRTNGNNNREVWLTGTDGAGSLLLAGDGVKADYHAYTPYGESPAAGVPVMRFRGERPDRVSGHYHLGNGYRTYSPALMQFLSPDSLSPFGAGGINPYAYCAGDPVNRSDPSGHFHLDWEAWVGIGSALFSLLIMAATAGVAIVAPVVVAAVWGVSVTMASAVTTVWAATSTMDLALNSISAVADVLSIGSAIASGFTSDSQLSQILGYVSLGLGLVGTISGISQVYREATPIIAARRLAADFRSRAATMGSEAGENLAQLRDEVRATARSRANTLPSSVGRPEEVRIIRSHSPTADFFDLPGSSTRTAGREQGITAPPRQQP